MSDLLPDPDQQLAPGTIVGGKYRIDGFLGAGGMGVVLSATHLELNAPVAIKVVRDELAHNEQIVSQLLFEARAVARMRSAHIVRVLDVAHLDSGAPYIVMERLEGWDLQTVLAERGMLSVREAVRHILQACEGLAEAHGLGIVHRDLKPENLYLATTPEGPVLKILDFGISKDIGPSIQPGRCSTLSKDGSAVGSPYYMSPEQMRAAPNLDARADIWSLGAILFELLTGQSPFEADTPAALCTKVLVEEPPTLRSVASRAPAELDAIITRCLQKDPNDRFQTVIELGDALREFVAEADRATADRAAVLREAERAEVERAATELTLATPKPAGPLAMDAAVAEPTPTNFTPESTRALLPRSHRVAWLSAGALLVSAAFGYWQLTRNFGAPEWLTRNHATAALVAPKATPSPAPDLRVPTPSSPVVSVVVAAPVAATVTAPATAAIPAAPSTAARSIAERPIAARPQVRPPLHVAAGPRFYTPPAPREPPSAPASAPWPAPAPAPAPAATATPDSPEARYGL